jgi:hypothetical protein
LPQRKTYDARRFGRRSHASVSEVLTMEFAAAVLFGSIVLWLVEEAADEHF